jgi:hypothetical protein
MACAPNNSLSLVQKLRPSREAHGYSHSELNALRAEITQTLAEKHDMKPNEPMTMEELSATFAKGWREIWKLQKEQGQKATALRNQLLSMECRIRRAVESGRRVNRNSRERYEQLHDEHLKEPKIYLALMAPSGAMAKQLLYHLWRPATLSPR